MLLVEDVRVSQRVASMALSRARYRVDVAMDGVDAVAKFKTGNYDVVLMDIQMPGMDGVEATRLIRQWEAEMKIPRSIIFGLTGSVEDADLVRYRSVQMDGCIAKGNVLVSAVKEALTALEEDPHKFVLSRLVH